MHTPSLLLLTALLAATHQVAAQTRDSARVDTLHRLAPVVVSGNRVNGVADDSPSPVDHVRLDGAPAGPAAAYQLLQRLPGVSLFDDQGSRLQPELDVRGFTVSPVVGQPQGVSVFLDGVRVNEPDAQEVNFDLIPMDAVDRAELVRGPATIFGKNSIAGSLLLFTDRGTQHSATTASLDAGGYGYKSARVQTGGTFQDLDGFLSARLSDETGWRQATSARTRMLFGNVGRKRDSTDLALTVMYANDKLFDAGSLPESYLDADPRLNYTPGDFFQPELLHLALRGDRYAGGGQLSGNVFWRRNDYEQYNGNVPPPNSDGFVHNLSYGGLAEWARLTHVGPLAATLTIGAEYSHARVAYRFLAVDRPGIPAGPQDLSALGCAAPSGLCTDIRTAEDDGALYAQALFALGPALELTAAVRGDYVRLPIVDLITPENGGTNTFWRPSPKVGLTYRVNANTRAYASFNTGFRAPAALELSCADAAAPCSLPFALGADPALQPVTVFDYEAGIDLAPSPRGTVNLSAFLSDVHDDILFVQPTATTGFFQNVARTRRAGTELSSSYEILNGLRVDGSYSYVAATYRSPAHLASALDDEPATTLGDRFPLSPAHRGNLGLDFTHSLARSVLQASVDLSAVSSQYLRGDEANVKRPLPGYALVDAHLIARLTHATISAYVTNLFDRRYVDFGLYAQNLRGAFGQPAPADPDAAPVERFLTPGQPRLLTVSVSIDR